VFLIAHSLTTAEKSGDVRSKYNARRTAGSNALHGLGFHSFGQALERYSVEELSELAAGISRMTSSGVFCMWSQKLIA